MSILLSSETKDNDVGRVELNKNNFVSGFLEKGNTKVSNYINSGVYCIKKSLLSDMIKETFLSLENELIPNWIKTKKIYGHVSNLPFVDIGTKDRFLSANFTK